MKTRRPVAWPWIIQQEAHVTRYNETKQTKQPKWQSLQQKAAIRQLILDKVFRFLFLAFGFFFFFFFYIFENAFENNWPNRNRKNRCLSWQSREGQSSDEE